MYYAGVSVCTRGIEISVTADYSNGDRTAISAKKITVVNLGVREKNTQGKTFYTP